MNDTKALSTELSASYRIKETPKNLKVEIGRYYKMSDGNGTKDIKIISIRKIDDQVIIYYTYKADSNSGKISDVWTNTERQSQMTVETFKAQCLEFGQITSIDLLYNEPKKGEDYFPIEEKN